MDLLSLIPIIFKLLEIIPKVQEALRTGASVIDIIKTTAPDLLPIFEQLGKQFFPTVTDPNQATQAAIDVLADKDGTLWIQSSLNKLGQTPPLVVDGDYGPKTKAAVNAFQVKHGLKQDSWAGALTSAAIATEVAKLPVPTP